MARVRVIRVAPIRWNAVRGVGDWGEGARACALGAGGVRVDKREGDGATPAGRFALRRVLYRRDRIPSPATRLPLAPLSPEDSWCDDPGDPRYNRQVTLPYPGGSERLWREDPLYDLLVVLGFNDDPPMPRRGSAIFLHVADGGYAPTGGCVAFALPDLCDLVAACDEATRVEIGASPTPP